MTQPPGDKLVIAVASSALFDLGEADEVFRRRGEEAYRFYTREHEQIPFPRGPGYAFIHQLLAVNSPPDFVPVEVILLSKNDSDTGLRVLNSIKHYDLPVIKAAFTCGEAPHCYIAPFHASLFLSANEDDVRAAVAADQPAGLIMASRTETEGPQEEDGKLRIAFDFDGIIADDSSERVFLEKGIEGFGAHEEEHSALPMPRGPLQPLLEKISRIQRGEFDKQKADPFYKPKIRTAIITARNASAQKRVVLTLRHWGIHVDEAFALGGNPKHEILARFRPHIFFDDQRANLQNPGVSMAMVHVPYGIKNQK